MTADDLKKLEQELKERESLLQACQDELNRRLAEIGKSVLDKEAPADQLGVYSKSPS
jgi:hypothetical protein